jgi:hypothetical protein
VTSVREQPAAAVTAPEPSPDAGRGARRTLVSALLTGLLGFAAVLAPVVADNPVLTWPRAGEAPVSTTLPLSPYRPLGLTADVPCVVLTALDRRGGGEALRTLPADVDPVLGSGLLVAVADGDVRITTGPPAGPGTRPVPDLVREPLPAGDCHYTVAADERGVTVTRDGSVLAQRPDLLPPQVAQLETAAAPNEAAGLSVTLRPDARYQSVPSKLKVALLVAHAVAIAVTLLLAVRTWPGRRRPFPRPFPRPRPHPADAVVLAVSAAWVVLGPLNIDDSWYTLMARGAEASGYLGNAIYQFNVTENPFVLSQYVLQAWGGVGGWGLAWLRLIPLAYGLATYAVLRWLLAVVLGRVALRPVVAWSLAGAHLLWFCGYGITLRPEPLIVLGSAVTWLLVELARRRSSSGAMTDAFGAGNPAGSRNPAVPDRLGGADAGRGTTDDTARTALTSAGAGVPGPAGPAIGLLALAVAAAALTITVSPTGLIAVAPLVLALPALLRWLHAVSTGARLAAVAALAAAGTVIVPVGFGDASLGDVLESLAVHTWYYRRHPWHDELTHYANVVAYDDRGSWGRRLPMLLTLAVLACALLGAARRRGTGGPTGRLLASAALLTGLGLVSMSLTPTKWVNHFGAVAAPATVLLTVALVRSPLPRRAGRAAVALGAVFAGAAAAVSYAGPNLWRPYSDWGQPFGDHSIIASPFEISRTVPGVGPLDLSAPLLWIAVAGAAVWWWRRRARPVGGLARDPEPARAVLTVATAGGVALFLVVFATAPLSQAPGASPASMNLDALTGGPVCGLADHVVVTPSSGPPIRAADVIGDAPVFADQAAAVLWPCARQITIRHGIAETPSVRLRTGDLLEGATENNSVFVPNGGVLAGVDRTARFVEFPSRLDPPGGSPMAAWGHLEIVFPDHPPGLYDLSVGIVQRPGWTRLPSLSGEPYSGRTFIG